MGGVVASGGGGWRGLRREQGTPLGGGRGQGEGGGGRQGEAAGEGWVVAAAVVASLSPTADDARRDGDDGQIP